MVTGRSLCCRPPETVAGHVGSQTPEMPLPSRYMCCLWIRSEPSETPMSTPKGPLWSPDPGSSRLLAPPLSTNTRDSMACLSTARLPGSSTRKSIPLPEELPCPGPSAQSAQGQGTVRGQVPAAAPLNRDCWDHLSPRGHLLMASSECSPNLSSSQVSLSH